MADVRNRAVQGDAVADVNVEAIFSVGLIDPVSISQGERLPLFTVTYKWTTFHHKNFNLYRPKVSKQISHVILFTEIRQEGRD